MSEWKMEINYCRTQSEANDNKIINPTHSADMCVCVFVPWVALRLSWPSYSVRCLQGPRGWSCWWCCVHAPLPPPAQTGQNRTEREKKKGWLLISDMWHTKKRMKAKKRWKERKRRRKEKNPIPVSGSWREWIQSGIWSSCHSFLLRLWHAACCQDSANPKEETPWTMTAYLLWLWAAHFAYMLHFI